jgi:DNA repair ATPase RecN
MTPEDLDRRLARIKYKLETSLNTLRAAAATEQNLAHILDKLERQTQAFTQTVERIEQYQQLIDQTQVNITRITKKLLQVEQQLAQRSGRNPQVLDSLQHFIHLAIAQRQSPDQESE